ncbi:8470_t:CDS:2, partial [Racocetra persica]
FWVKYDNSTFLTTAGHCAENATRTPDGIVRVYYLPWSLNPTSYLIGEMGIYEYHEVDRGFISIDDNSTLVVPSIRNSDDAFYPQLHIIGTVDIDTEGSNICIAGVIDTDIVTRGGDSGGPAFQLRKGVPPYVYLAGMLISGDNDSTIIEPLSMILSDGVMPVTFNPDLLDLDARPRG